MEEAQEKLKRILDLASPEDNEKLRKELSKMIPLDNNSRVTAKIGWGYQGYTQVGITFMVVPYAENKDAKNAYSLFYDLMSKADIPFSKFNESFDVILEENSKKINLGFIPALEIAEKTKACSLNFKIL